MLMVSSMQHDTSSIHYQLLVFGEATMAWSVNEKVPNDDWLYDMKGNTYKQCQFLVTNNLAKPPVCNVCHCNCISVLITSSRDSTRNRLPYKWKCINNDCKKTYNFLHGSYFKGKRVFKHIQLLYKFYLGRTAKQCAQETGLSSSTCTIWFDYFRRCIHKYMQDYFYPNFEFDVDLAVEWDEAALSAKQKDHRGRYKEPVWVLGGVQRRNNFCLLKVVDKRKAETLHPIITSVCSPGSTVVTDGWRAYYGLNRHGLFHWNVDHTRGFVNPFTRQHTDTIEGLWSLIRYELRAQRGIKPIDLQKHLDVFAFRRNTRDSNEGTWTQFCCLVGAMQSLVQTPS